MNRRLLKALVFGLSIFICAGAYAEQKPDKVVIDVSRNWDRYDAYVHKMMNAIQSQWKRILSDSKTAAPSGTFVAVKFTMDSKGRIKKILDVGSTSSEAGEQCCMTAVTMSAPFGDWTDGMVAALGTSQELTVRFYYQ
jgi:hypothetical protein